MDYTPNSRRDKPGQNADKTAERKKHSAIVTSASVKKKSELSKIASSFIAEEAANIKNKALNDILLPTIRDTIWSIFTSSLEMLLYGGTSRFAKSSRSTGTYAAPYIDYSSPKKKREREPESRSNSRIDLDDVVFRTEDDALNVLDNLRDDVKEYGVAKVGDLYDLSNMAHLAPFTADRYGWTNLDRAEVVRLRGGVGYIIKFPKPMAIER